MRGHLVIADISGYTKFLTESELEHAHGIITELLNAVIGAIQAPLTVSSIEGDAVFMYGEMPEGTSGQAVLESVEMLYCAFAGALETMILNTTCECNACVNIKALGMKIVMHCGEFARSTIGGRETLSGPDVILAHRLLKNEIRETTGIDDYMLVTQACVDDLGVERIVAGWMPHTEEYEHVGEVAGYVSSLPDVWAFVRQQNEDKVLQKDAWRVFSAYSQAPPLVVWDHVIDARKRNQWLQAHENRVFGEADGRIAPGAEFHCAHGQDELAVFVVLDMRALDYITFLLPMGDMAMRWTEYLVPSGSGTRVVCVVAPIHWVETGEAVDDQTLEAMEAGVVGYEDGLSRMVLMADEAAARIVGA